MSVKDQVLEIIKASAAPVTAGEVEKLSGLERKAVDKAFTELKKKMRLSPPSAANGKLQ